ncbi:Thioredoxin domain protein [Minicystis rosea]|nr:Thioredoxin domain protein [Minicystis rosea]
MRKIAPILLLRLALLVAVLACAVLVIEYQNMGDPAFCGVGSGCMAVRRSQWARIGTVPLPALGLSAYAVLLAMSLGVREKMHSFFLAAAAIAGGLIGATLLAIQAFQLHTFCKWCVMVDVSAIVAAAAASWMHREIARSAAYEAWFVAFARGRGQLIVGAVGALLAGLLPTVWGQYPVVPPMPEAVAALAVPDKVTIVAFTDFECPFCRKMHPVLHDIAKRSGGRVTLVRKMVPLSFHQGAKPAALGYLCTPAGSRERMADSLYGAPQHLLNATGVAAIAAGLGLDREAFTRCVDAPETAAALHADEALFASLKAPGLPFTYIGSRVVAGFNEDAARKLASAASNGGRPSLPVSWMLVLFAAVCAVVAGLTVRLSQRETEPVALPAP